MAPYKFSKKHCQEWIQDKQTNPKTGYSIDPTASNGVYKKLKRQCNVYEELAIKTRRLSACRSRSKKLRKELMSAMEKLRTLLDAPMSKKDAEKNIMATSPTIDMMRPIIEEEMASYDVQHMKYALRVIKFMYSIVDDSYPQLTFGEVKRMGDEIIGKFTKKAAEMSSPYKDQFKNVISMLQFYMDYIEKHWNRFKQQDTEANIMVQDRAEIEELSEDDMAIIPYKPNTASKDTNASSMKILQYTNASRANTPRTNTQRTNSMQTGTPRTNSMQTGTPPTNTIQANTPRTNTQRTNSMQTGTPRANTPRANTNKEKTPDRINSSINSDPYISTSELSRSVSSKPKSSPPNTVSSVSSWMTYVPESRSTQKSLRNNTAQELTNTLPVSPPVSIVDFTSTQKRAKSSLKTDLLQLDDYDMDKMLLLLDEMGISKKSMKSTLADKRSRMNALYDYIERHWDRFKQEIDAQDSTSSMTVSLPNAKRTNTNAAPRLSQEELQDYHRDTFMTILAFFGLSNQDLQDVDLIDVRKEFKRKTNASASEDDKKMMDQLLAYIDRHWSQFKDDARERIVTGSTGSFKTRINSMAAVGSSSSETNKSFKADNPLFNSSSAAKSANKSARVTQSMNTNPLFNALNSTPGRKNSKK